MSNPSQISNRLKSNCLFSSSFISNTTRCRPNGT